MQKREGYYLSFPFLKIKAYGGYGGYGGVKGF
jgi:hypothetical protein